MHRPAIDESTHVATTWWWRAEHDSRLVPTLDAFAAALVAVALLDDVVLRFAYVAVLLGVFAGTGDYRPRLDRSLGDELPRLVGLASLPSIALAMFNLSEHRHVVLLVKAAPLVVILLAIGRAVSYAVLRSRRRQPDHREPTLIVGSGKVAESLVAHLQRRPCHGLQPVGLIDDDPFGRPPLPVLGGFQELTDVINRHGVRAVIIAFGRHRESELVGVIRRCQQFDLQIYVVPRLFELGVTTSDHIDGVPLVCLSRPTHRPGARRAKRCFDLVVASTVVVAASPVLALIALLVRLSSPGAILFRQERVGQYGRPIQLLKFRTLLENDDSDTTWSVADDDRVTRIGSFLRRTSLDEMPQLFNVIRGDMSLVGPRPERPSFVTRFNGEIRGYGERLRVPVGMTGLAQVHGLRGDTSISQRVWFDNRYIEDWSLWSDVVILFRTVVATLRMPAYVSQLADVAPFPDITPESSDAAPVRAAVLTEAGSGA